jgi:hypothetical protein
MTIYDGFIGRRIQIWKNVFSFESDPDIAVCFSFFFFPR